MNEEFQVTTEELRELNIPEEKECRESPIWLLPGAAPCTSSSDITKV